MKCPCNRAVACTPPEESPVSVSLQNFLLSSLDSNQLDFRIQTPFEATIRSRLLRPGYLLTTPYSGFVNRLQDSSFPPCLLSKLRGSDFFPGRLASFLLNISALSGRTGTPRSPCTKGYRAVAKRRSAYAAMPRLGIPSFSVPSVRTRSFAFKTRHFVFVFSLCSPCSLCEPDLLFFIPDILSLCPLCALCVLCANPIFCFNPGIFSLCPLRALCVLCANKFFWHSLLGANP